MRVRLASSSCFVLAFFGLVASCWAQAQPAASAPDVPALIDRLAAARQSYAEHRPADAQRELSEAIDILRPMAAAGRAQRAPIADGQLPRGGKDVPMPGLLHGAAPEYPLDAAIRGITGHVALDVVIDKNGNVRNPRVAHSIPGLDQAARKAALASKFAKPMVDGAPAEISATLVFAFTLRRDPMTVDDIDLGRFYVERGDYARAEPPLSRALGVITRENACFALPAGPSNPTRGEIGQRVKPPVKIKDVKPIYPEIAQGSRVQGLVVIEAAIDVDGHVTCGRVKRSVPILDQAALDAVSQWEFTPTLLDGSPTRVLMTVTVNFSLQ